MELVLNAEVSQLFIYSRYFSISDQRQHLMGRDGVPGTGSLRTGLHLVEGTDTPTKAAICSDSGSSRNQHHSRS